METGHPVYSADLENDDRWGEQAAAQARGAGLMSTAYAIPLSVADRSPLTVLTLYSKRLDGFDEEDRAMADVIAAHALVAVADAVDQDHLKTALETRTVIGQATGIVVERWGLVRAGFAALKRLSQSENVKLREIPERIVATGKVESD